jgi:hypothetical protein
MLTTTCEESRPNHGLAAGRDQIKHLVRAAKRAKKQVCGVKRVLCCPSAKNLRVTVARARIAAIMQSPSLLMDQSLQLPVCLPGYCQRKSHLLGIGLRMVFRDWLGQCLVGLKREQQIDSLRDLGLACLTGGLVR